MITGTKQRIPDQEDYLLNIKKRWRHSPKIAEEKFRSISL